MKTAIILPGMASKEEYFDPEGLAPSNRHWKPWLQHHLLIRGILAQTPEMPESYTPQYEKWCSIFELFPITEETILVGHSCGAGFLVRWLSENKVKTGRVVLVALWLDPGKELKTGFFDFEIDSELVSKTAGVTVVYSTDDYESITESINILKERVKNLEFKEFTDKGHFTLEDMKTEKFPELLEILTE